MNEAKSHSTVVPFDKNQEPAEPAHAVLQVLVLASCPWRRGYVRDWLRKHWSHLDVRAEIVSGQLELEGRSFAHSATLIFCERPTQILAQAWLERGIVGIVPFDLEIDLAKRAVDYVIAGGRFVPADLEPGEPLPDVSDWRLTARERDVAGHLVEGTQNKQIAFKLDIAEATVKVYVRGILRKLNCRNRTQAARLLADRLR